MTEQRACTRESVQRGFLSGSLFFFVNGDANRDQRVNLDDFNILAANFGQFGRAFSEGDVNYDGAEVRNGACERTGGRSTDWNDRRKPSVVRSERRETRSGPSAGAKAYPLAPPTGRRAVPLAPPARLVLRAADAIRSSGLTTSRPVPAAKCDGPRTN